VNADDLFSHLMMVHNEFVLQCTGPGVARVSAWTHWGTHATIRSPWPGHETGARDPLEL